MPSSRALPGRRHCCCHRWQPPPTNGTFVRLHDGRHNAGAVVGRPTAALRAPRQARCCLGRRLGRPPRENTRGRQGDSAGSAGAGGHRLSGRRGRSEKSCGQREGQRRCGAGRRGCGTLRIVATAAVQPASGGSSSGGSNASGGGGGGIVGRGGGKGGPGRLGGPAGVRRLLTTSKRDDVARRPPPNESLSRRDSFSFFA